MASIEMNIEAIISSKQLCSIDIKSKPCNLCETDIQISAPDKNIEDSSILLFPLLTKMNKNGNKSFWMQYVRGNKIYRFAWVDMGNTIREFEPAIGEGKNVGRKNEVLPEEDALREAVFEWDKKVSQSYIPSEGYIYEDEHFNWNLHADAEEIHEDNDYKEGHDLRTRPNTDIRPMLAKEFDEDHVSYPVGVSAKLDGVRCVAQLYDDHGTDKAHLMSRNGKPFPKLATIEEAVKALITEYSNGQIQKKNLILDGELYIHSIPFNDIASIVRTSKKTHPDVEKLQYHIFDIIDTSLSYTQRASLLENLQSISKRIGTNKILHFVLYDVANNINDIHTLYSDIMAEGYEGVIIRKLNSIYSSTRTRDLMKYKEFKDAEFEIVGVTKSVGGTEDGAAIIEVKTPNGNITVRMQGSIEYRRQLYADGKKLLGKMLTVRFQPSIDKNDKPRFPVGVAIRDYE